jgi:hypothetical protein
LELYFERIQCFLPLFHRPTFRASLLGEDFRSDGLLGKLSLETAFVLNGIFALSARFSTSEFFTAMKSRDRGVDFAKAASTLLERYQTQDHEQPTLRMLQGSVLLACYYLASGWSSRGWYLLGICSRQVYELGLHQLDHDVIAGNHTEAVQDWVGHEEKRRVWWSAWELDCFVSTISCRPYCFDRNRVEVLLPVSDKAWFRNEPVASAPLKTDPLTVWKSLEDCPNQDEWAWFLVTVYLVRLANELLQQPGVTPPQMHKDLDTVITCFALALPSKFDLSSDSLSFDQENKRSSSWIISTNLMLQGQDLSNSRLIGKRH